MPFTDALVAEIDQEMKTTRSLLERVPMDKASWKPHGKSMSLGQLASHLANLARFGGLISNGTELDFSPPGQAPAPQPQYTTREEVLKVFDTNVKNSREAIARMSEESTRETWTLKHSGNVLLSAPRKVLYRTLFMNHIIHHRGQLSVYLRLNDVPLPSIYGPTADMV
jgi:uncharacterized damage-inducible protein DinB